MIDARADANLDVDRPHIGHPHIGQSYTGLLVIGDPHLEGRCPGFRRDDYPHVVLEKVGWCMSYADQHELLPAFLGDFFDKPRDNPTWMLARLIEMFRERAAIGIYGNHDCAENVLTDNDSLTILVKAGCLQLIDAQQPWVGKMNGRDVVIGGSSYRQPIPEYFELAADQKETLFDRRPLVIWLTHHDINVPGYDGVGRQVPHPITNVDLLINGHIHRQLEPVSAGATVWMTPGNIARRKRSDASRDHVPSILQIDIDGEEFRTKYVRVPHRPFEEVFYESVNVSRADENASGFVAGLAELQKRKTASGAALSAFLEQNLDQFEPAIAAEIMSLAMEVTERAEN